MQKALKRQQEEDNTMSSEDEDDRMDDEEYYERFGMMDGDSNEPQSESHFFGGRIEAKSSETYELTSVNLHLTRAVIAVEADNKGHFPKNSFATLAVTTPSIPDKIVVALLNTPEHPQQLLDSAFFSHDERVQLHNDGNTAVYISGVVETKNDDDDDDSEDEDYEMAQEGEDDDDDESDDEESKREGNAITTEADKGKSKQLQNEPKQTPPTTPRTAGEKRQAEPHTEEGEKLTKSQKKKLKKQKRQEQEKEAAETPSAGEKANSQPSAQPAPKEPASKDSKKKEAMEKMKAETSEKTQEATATAKSSVWAKKHPVHKAKHGLHYQDIEVGMGGVPTPGKKVQIGYVGKLAKNGKTFDSNDKFEFRLGVGKVIKGMDLGIQSMRVGGHRRILIPANLGYGSQGAGNAIPPNASLVFDVTLKKTY